MVEKMTAQNTLAGLSVVAAEIVEDNHDWLVAGTDSLSPSLCALLVGLGEDLVALGRAAEVISRYQSG